MVLPVFAEDVAIDGPTGKYRFLATFQQGAAAAGGEIEFYVADPGRHAAGRNGGRALGRRCRTGRVARRSMESRPSDGRRRSRDQRAVILVSTAPGRRATPPRSRELARRIARGSTVVFLSPAVFKRGDSPVGWLPLANKGSLTAIPSWLYLKDEWAKRHPIFDGLPAGGLMDNVYYRELIPDAVWSGQDPPAEAVAGAIKTSQGYASGLTMAVYPLGAGRFVLNTLAIRENLGRHPAAERLLRNMLRYAARDAGKPVGRTAGGFRRSNSRRWGIRIGAETECQPFDSAEVSVFATARAAFLSIPRETATSAERKATIR